MIDEPLTEEKSDPIDLEIESTNTPQESKAEIVEATKQKTTIGPEQHDASNWRWHQNGTKTSRTNKKTVHYKCANQTCDAKKRIITDSSLKTTTVLIGIHNHAMPTQKVLPEIKRKVCEELKNPQAKAQRIHDDLVEEANASDQ